MILGEGPTFRINGGFGSPEKKVSTNFTKANTKFCLNLHYNADNSYLFVNGKEIFRFEADNKNINFSTQFLLDVYLTDIVLLSLEKYLQKETCMIFDSITILLANLAYQTFTSI